MTTRVKPPYGSPTSTRGSLERRAYPSHMYPAELRPFYAGWREHQDRLNDALRSLGPDGLRLRAAPGQWAVWQIAAHMAGARAYWFHTNLGEGDRSISELFRVEHTTVTGLALGDAGWEDDEDHPRTLGELLDALAQTWTLVDGCLQRWTPADLEATVQGPTRSHHRGWVVWHVLEHDLHHGGEISQILGSNGLAGLDI